MIKSDKGRVEIQGNGLDIMKEFVMIAFHLKDDIGEEFFNKTMEHLEEIRSGELYKRCKEATEEA